MQWWTLKQLRSRNPRGRLAAVNKLEREEGAALIEPLGEMLSDTDSNVRAAVAEALSRTGDPKAVPFLGARLPKEPEPLVRVAIVKALLEIPNPSAIPVFIEALSDLDGDVAWHAAKGLQGLRWQPANATERAAWHLATGQFDEVVTCGTAAIEPLARLTRSIAFQRVIRVVECLSRVGGTQAVKPLLDCLASPDFTIRSAAATALGEVGDARAFEPLLRALRDSQHQVCLAACSSLGKLGDQRAAEPLTKVLKHTAPDVRTAAVAALGKLGDTQAVGPVLPLLQDSDHDVREAAVTALGLMGNEEAIEPLVLSLIDPQSSIRQAASYALRRIEPYWERSEAAARAIPKLQLALKSREYGVCHNAADTLKKLGVSQEREASLVADSDGALRKRRAAQTILVSLLTESDREFRQAAAEALGRIGLADSMVRLVERLTDTDRGVQAASARSLEMLRWQPAQPVEKARQLVALERWSDVIGMGNDAVDALAGALAWNDASARRYAIGALVQIGGARAVATLRGLAGDPVPAIRDEALAALAVLESHSAGPPIPGTKDIWGEAPALS